MLVEFISIFKVAQRKCHHSSRMRTVVDMGQATVETMASSIMASSTTVAKAAILASSSNTMVETISNSSKTLKLRQPSKSSSHASYESWKVAALSCKV